MTEMKVTAQEEKLLQLIRKTDSGEVRIVVKDGHPIRAEQTVRHIPLHNENVKKS